MAGEIKLNNVSIATENAGTVTINNATLGNSMVLGTNASPIANNLVFANGNGIDFSAAAGSASGSSSAVLDDYEEGTWQMRWSENGYSNDTDSLGNGTQTESYVKIGSLVYLTGDISYSANSNITSGFFLNCTGVPFTIEGFCQGTMTVYNNSGGTTAQFNIEGASTTLVGIKNSDYSSPNNMTYSSDSGAGAFPSAGRIKFSVIYKAV